MHVGSIVVRIEPGWLASVERLIAELPGATLVGSSSEGVAMLLRAPSVRAQRALHDEVLRWPGVVAADLVFQSANLES